MKQLAIAFFLVVLAIACHAALVSSNLLTLVSLTSATNTGPTTALGNIVIPQTTFAIQTVGTGGTNGAGGYILMGLTTNAANMTVVGYYAASSDTIYSMTLTNSGVVPVYCAFKAFNTTNIPIQIGAQAIQQQ